MERMRQHAERWPTRTVVDHIKRADLLQRPFVLEGDSGLYSCEICLIIATGASAKYLGLPSEKAFLGEKAFPPVPPVTDFFTAARTWRLSAAAVRRWTLYLSNIARHVTVVHRREQFRAEKMLAA